MMDGDPISLVTTLIETGSIGAVVNASPAMVARPREEQS
jgi:hypothetical protein